MPKKPTTTKETIIEGAFRLIREQGHEALTVRNLAAFMGCSTQPIMYQFPETGVLKELAYRKAEDLLEIGLRYIRFAEEEPQLFKFLFQSGRFSGFTLEELIRAPETSGVIAAVVAEANLTPEEAISFFEPLAALVHGYASLIANNAMKYDPEAMRAALTRVAEGLETIRLRGQLESEGK